MYLFSNDETKVVCTIKKMLELSKNNYIENIVGFEELEAIERLLDLFLELERVHEASHEGIIEIIKELEEQTHKIINTTYIPNCSEIFNKNKEKYEPMLEARNILINALNGLKELLEEE